MNISPEGEGRAAWVATRGGIVKMFIKDVLCFEASRTLMFFGPCTLHSLRWRPCNSRLCVRGRLISGSSAQKSIGHGQNGVEC